jgi:fructan beta-fructosidase
VVIGYDRVSNQYFIDRSRSGITEFNKEFAAKHQAPRFVTNTDLKMTLVVDVASVELFADNGLTVMTEIFFPSQPFNKISLRSSANASIKEFNYQKLGARK